jgi:hypothetical protein
MKNMFGVVPGARYGWPKNILHWKGIQESILDRKRQRKHTVDRSSPRPASKRASGLTSEGIQAQVLSCDLTTSPANSSRRRNSRFRESSPSNSS